ncbi:LysR substrate-binding domain-containing protein [Paraburkholderia sp. IW21]|uniref:LysR substrate-binding domain-containing protein n=1 Tax=Paraburkholderia sp. IW21 TaxID=3242488 RepID=UPI003520853E
MTERADAEPKMDFRHIDAFRAVMLARTSTKAAQLINLSQSAISRLIADLERSTQLTLFNRERGRLEPTAEAYSLFAEVERRYAGLDNIREFALSLRSPEMATIRVGSVLSFGLGYFARAIARFREVYPTVRIGLTTGSSQLIRDQVVARTLALGLVTDTIDFAETDAVSFSKLDAVCAVPAHHPLASRPVITLDDLRAWPVISYEPSDMVRWGMDWIFDPGNLGPQVAAIVRYSVNVCALVRENVGVGLVHPVAAYDFLDSGLVFRRFEPAMTFHTLRLKPRSPAASTHVEDLIAVLDETLTHIVSEVEARL